jgi:predicted nucleic acid-binding protein
MFLIDTNIHAAYLLQHFENDDLTKQYLARYNNIPLRDRVVPDFILGEFETFIMKVVPSRYQLNAEDTQKLKHLAFAYIKTLTEECTIVASEVQTIEHARDLYFESAPTSYLSFVDCLVLATAEHNTYTVFTKDMRVNKLAEKLHIASYKPQA